MPSKKSGRSFASRYAVGVCVIAIAALAAGAVVHGSVESSNEPSSAGATTRNDHALKQSVMSQQMHHLLRKEAGLGEFGCAVAGAQWALLDVSTDDAAVSSTNLGQFH
jgi:hypothetical protein